MNSSKVNKKIQKGIEYDLEGAQRIITMLKKHKETKTAPKNTKLVSYADLEKDELNEILQDLMKRYSFFATEQNELRIMIQKISALIKNKA